MQLLKSHFEHCAIGPIKNRDLKKAFPLGKVSFLMGRKDKFLFNLGLKASYGATVPSSAGQIIKVTYPPGCFGRLTGAQWKVGFASTDSAFLKYKIFVSPGFEFVKGGKLPGLAGGTGNSGGNVPTGYDGWSARFMFKEEGRLCAYLYYPGMPGQYGEKFFLKSGNDYFILPSGQWVEIGLKVTLNSVGDKNGIVACYINDELLLEKDNLEFRKSDVLGIDHLLFSTFFGGDDPSYAPKHECTMYFKDFVVYQ